MPLSRRLEAGTQSSLLLHPKQRLVRDRILASLDNGTYTLQAAPCFCGAPREDESTSLVIAERDRYGLPVRTVLCARCGLMRTDPYMTPETTRRFYQDDYRDLYTAQGPQALFDGQVKKGVMLAERLLRIPGIKTVYDVGCGAGGLLVPFQQAGCVVAGCDYGDDYLNKGRERRLDLVCGDVNDLLAHTGCQADLVTLIHVAEHFTALREQLEAVVSAIKPGGLLLIEVPGAMALGGAYQEDIMLYLQNAHTYHFTAATLSYVVRSLGLNVLSADEHVLLLAQRPEDPTQTSNEVAPEPQSARELLHYLARLERACLTQLAEEQRANKANVATAQASPPKSS